MIVTHRSHPLTAEEHCQECDWNVSDDSFWQAKHPYGGCGPELTRAVRRHVRKTGHLVIVDRTVSHYYEPAEDEVTS